MIMDMLDQILSFFSNPLIIGFIGGLLMAFLYNVVSKLIGGVEVHVEEIKEFTSDNDDKQNNN